jgi:hypothetical protein
MSFGSYKQFSLGDISWQPKIVTLTNDTVLVVYSESSYSSCGAAAILTINNTEITVTSRIKINDLPVKTFTVTKLQNNLILVTTIESSTNFVARLLNIAENTITVISEINLVTGDDYTIAETVAVSYFSEDFILIFEGKNQSFGIAVENNQIKIIEKTGTIQETVVQKLKSRFNMFGIAATSGVESETIDVYVPLITESE